MMNKKPTNPNVEHVLNSDQDGFFSNVEIDILKKLALATKGASFTQEEIIALREMLKFSERIQWLVKTMAGAAKWLSIVFGGYIVLSEFGFVG